MERPERRFFPEEFKREAVAQVEASGRSAEAIATDLGLCDTVLRKWVRQFGPSPQAPLAPVRPLAAAPAPSPADQAAEIARLKREFERTRPERDILKEAVVICGREPR